MWKRRKKRAGRAFILRVAAVQDELCADFREPRQIIVSRLAMRGAVSTSVDDHEPDIYVHPDDWANVDVAAEDFTEDAGGPPVTMLWGMPVVREAGTADPNKEKDTSSGCTHPDPKSQSNPEEGRNG